MLVKIFFKKTLFSVIAIGVKSPAIRVRLRSTPNIAKIAGDF